MSQARQNETTETGQLSRRVFLMRVGALSTLAAYTPGIAQLLAAEEITYETLSSELYAKTPQEEAYVADVIDQMNQGTIPRKIVYASRNYALKRQKTLRIIYFDRCLRQLCARAKIRVKLPPLR
ncbi:MAG: hypothetical protein Q4G68_15065 [Planctomycetia bacterium]|nr:hypothetical protein [Planctomycetia bacterium]